MVANGILTHRKARREEAKAVILRNYEIKETAANSSNGRDNVEDNDPEDSSDTKENPIVIAIIGLFFAMCYICDDKSLALLSDTYARLGSGIGSRTF